MTEDSILEYSNKTIDKNQFEEIYSNFYDECVQKYGAPARSFISVVSFGNKVKEELKELLDKHNVVVYTDSYVDKFELKESGFNRLSEIQSKLL